MSYGAKLYYCTGGVANDAGTAAASFGSCGRAGTSNWYCNGAGSWITGIPNDCSGCTLGTNFASNLCLEGT